MILDGAALDPKKLPTYDICIVGSGAVGIAMAQRLHGKKKKDGKPLLVAVLESSVHNVPRNPYTKHATDPTVIDLEHGVVNDFTHRARPEGFLTASRSRVFGGSTNCWGGYVRPLDEHDFDGWPLKRQDLDAYYRQALDLMKLDHFDWFDDPQAWINSNLTENTIDQLVLPTGSPLRTVVIQQQQDESTHCFQLQFGKIFDDPTNLTLIRNATVWGMPTAPAAGPKSFQASSLTCGSLLSVDQRGQDFTVKAKYYVLAMGGLEIPRFLLNCIPGSYGLTELVDRGLGKYYMNHPKYESCGYGVLSPNESISSAISQFYGDTRLRDDPSVHIYAYLVPDPANRVKSINNFRMAIGLPAARRFHEVPVSCEINFEQEPNAASTITLAKEEKPDIFKMRRLSLDWRFLPKDAETMTCAIEQTKQLFSSLGVLLGWQATEWKFDPALPHPPLNGKLYTGDHHMGVCRMRSDDAVDDGVVNSRCQASGFTNLWLCSTGVFRRGGWANATFTLLALALRLADDLAKEPPLQAA